MRFDLKKGFTLMETVLTVVVMAIISAVLMGIVSQGMRIWTTGQQQSEMRGEARFFLEKISREIFEADLVYMAGSQISLSYDYNSDGIFDVHRYYLSGTNVLLSITGSTAITIATGISSLSFAVQTYTTPSTYTACDINLTVQKINASTNYRTKVVSRRSLQ